MEGQVTLERLLARDERQTARQLLRHQMPSFAQLVLVRLRDEILGDELLG